MFNSATAEPITHVLLLDEESPQVVRDLSDNMRLVSDCYRRLLHRVSDSIMESKYRVVFAVPESSALATTCQTISAELKAGGIHTHLALVKAEDMFAYQGKVGLLLCVLWCIAGAVLLNEVPISDQQSEKLIIQANRFHRTTQQLALMNQGWFQRDCRLGLIRSYTSISRLLGGAPARFPDHHSVSDILRAMKANCPKKDLFVVK